MTSNKAFKIKKPVAGASVESVSGELNPKQMSFVREYMIDKNGKQAAIRAGYEPGGAEVQASRMLRNVKVKLIIQRMLKDQEKRLFISADRILANLYDLAEDKTIKTSDRIKALELLAKHKKLITDSHEFNGQVVVRQMGRVLIDGKPLEFRVGRPVSSLKLIRD